MFLDLSKIETSRCLRFFRCFWISQKSKKVDVRAFLDVFGPLKNRKKSMFAFFWAFLDLSKIRKKSIFAFFLGVFGRSKNRTKLMFAFFWAFFDGPKFEKTSIRFRFNPVPVQIGCGSRRFGFKIHRFAPVRFGSRPSCQTRILGTRGLGCSVWCFGTGLV